MNGLRMCWPGQMNGACRGEVRVRTVRSGKVVMCKAHWTFYRGE